MPLFTGGYIQFKREALRNIAQDENLKEGEQWFFIRLITFTWPYDFIMSADDGYIKASIKIKKGELYATIRELMSGMGEKRKQTITDRLRKLNLLQYIDYEPGKNQYKGIYLKIRDYDYYIDSATTKIVAPNATTKNGVTLSFATTKIVEAIENATPINVESTPIATTKNVELIEDKFSDTKENQASNNKQQYVVNNKQQQEDVVVEIQSLFKRKAKKKMPDHICVNLLSRFPQEKIIQNIRRLNFDKADNPIGYLITSLEEDWDIPVSQEEKIEAEQQARDEEEKRWQEKLKRVQQEALPPEQAIEKIEGIKSILRRVGIGK